MTAHDTSLQNPYIVLWTARNRSGMEGARAGSGSRRTGLRRCPRRLRGAPKLPSAAADSGLCSLRRPLLPTQDTWSMDWLRPATEPRQQRRRVVAADAADKDLTFSGRGFQVSAELRDAHVEGPQQWQDRASVHDRLLARVAPTHMQTKERQRSFGEHKVEQAAKRFVTSASWSLKPQLP